MISKKSNFQLKIFLNNYKEAIILFFLLIIHLFSRFYQLDSKNVFGWDQVDNAWVAKDIIIDHKWPLLGMQAKGSSGFYIGPLYYYLIAIVYFFTNLDPIASGIFAGICSTFTFFVLYFLTQKLFSYKVALITIFIHTFSFHIIKFDRTQWPVNLITPTSLIIFFALYKIINGKTNYLFLLATTIGFSFHLNFTSILFPLITLFVLPFFPRNKQLLKNLAISLPLFLVWFAPNFLAEAKKQDNSLHNSINYLTTYYHGLHLRRMLQLAADAFIEFEGVLLSKLKGSEVIKSIKYIFFPLFSLIYFFSKPSKKRLIFCYLVGLWFFIPWLVFSVYSGEITSYYFSLTRPMVILILAYLTFRLLEVKNLFVKTVVVSFWLFYSFINTQAFLDFKYPSFNNQRTQVKEAIKRGEVIEFKQGASESYLYYIYSREKN